ncbi:hypothetical protein Tco_0773475 [Tanacetum coccineum]|uniref:Uncharacterized protein n=1 Tax=Tanacetum coccineum TaxID=301880 RepID=A0ABQ4ZL00_9ASTR
MARISTRTNNENSSSTPDQKTRHMDRITDQIHSWLSQTKETTKKLRQINGTRASTNAAIRNQGESIKTLEIQIGQMSKVLHERVNPDSSEIRRMGCSPYAVSAHSTEAYFLKQFPS